MIKEDIGRVKELKMAMKTKEDTILSIELDICKKINILEYWRGIGVREEPGFP